MKKSTYQQAMSELDRVATKKAALPVKRMMADVDRLDPPPRKRKRKARKQKTRNASGRLGRFASGGLPRLLNESTRLLKELDPRAEWETGVAELREQYHALRRHAPGAVETAPAPRPRASRRTGASRSRARSRKTVKRTR